MGKIRAHLQKLASSAKKRKVNLSSSEGHGPGPSSSSTFIRQNWGSSASSHTTFSENQSAQNDTKSFKSELKPETVPSSSSSSWNSSSSFPKDQTSKSTLALKSIMTSSSSSSLTSGKIRKNKSKKAKKTSNRSIPISITEGSSSKSETGAGTGPSFSLAELLETGNLLDFKLSGQLRKYIKDKREELKTQQIQTTQTENQVSSLIPSLLKVKSKSVIPQLNSLDSNGLDVLKKMIKSKVRTKKDRSRLKRDVFHKKVEMCKNVMIEEMESKKREKTVIVGDMKPLMDALEGPTKELEESKAEADLKIDLLKQFQNKPVPGSRPPKKVKMNRRDKEIAEGLEYFGAVLNSDKKL